MRKVKQSTLLLLTAAIIGLFFVYLFYFTPVKIVELNADMTIVTGKHIGFNLDSDAIHFGDVPLYGSSVRNITLTNGQSPLRVHLSTDNSFLGSLIRFSDNDFVLRPFEHKSVTLFVKVPAEAKPGNYTAKVIVSFYRPFIF